MDQKELNKVLKSRKKWFEKNGPENIDLRCANLKGVDLSSADLSYADLTCANLKGANLTDVNLTDANLRLANLRGADLRGANLKDANLSHTDFTGADLEYSCLNLSRPSLTAKYDDRHLIQLLHHVANLGQNYNIADPQLKELLNLKTFKDVCTKFKEI